MPALPTINPFTPKTAIDYRANMIGWLKALGSSLSNFNPGSRIGSLIESIAIELADSDLNTLNGLKQAILEGSYYTFGFSRLVGAKAGGFVRLEHAASLVNIIYPIFTIDLFGIQYTTVQSVTLLAGSTFIEVDILAVNAGSVGNISAGTIDTNEGRGSILSTIEPDTRVWNPADISGGTDEESDIDRLSRWQVYIQGLGRSNVAGILTGLSTIPGMVDFVLVVNVNPYTQLPEDNWIDCYVTDGTPTPSLAFLQLVYDTIAGKVSDPTTYPGYAAANANVYVAGITLQAVSVDFLLTVILSSSLTVGEALGIANNAAINYVNNLPTGQDVLYDQLKASILKAHPDFLKCQVLLPAGDVSIITTSKARLGGTGGGTLTSAETPREVPT
jgi:hypothetical protein